MDNNHTEDYVLVQEDCLHWQLDVTFKEDACRARKNYSARNLNPLRKFTIAIRTISSPSRLDDGKVALIPTTSRKYSDLMWLPWGDSMILHVNQKAYIYPDKQHFDIN